MKAVILAGGKGTRLASQTRDIPKPMITIGGVPILEHQLRLLKLYEITEVIILVNYLGNVIVDYFRNGEKFGVNIEYFEEDEPLGTVGGIKEIEDRLSDDFIVFYGDVMVNMDLKKLMQFHNNKKSECTLVIHPNNHPYDSDLVETDDDARIVNVISKKSIRNYFYKNLVNAGVYILSPEIFKFLHNGEKADFGRDIFPVIFQDIRMFGYNTPEYLKDMGTPDRLEEVEKDYQTGKIERMNFQIKRSAIFLDRDGVINHEISFIHLPEQFKLYDYASEAVKKINSSEHLSIVITNQSVIARNLCTIEELELIHKKMETELGKNRAKLDAIYYCPHHPDKGFPEERPEYKIECDCRKPKPGMLIQASKDLNIDLESSFMIGDSERDILAGYNAGCNTIGVRTGYGIKKAVQKPDYVFQNLKEAVDFIIDDPFKEVLLKVETAIERACERPFVLLIGGNSRSGKSTLATYLRKNLSLKNHVLHVELDNWLLPENKREMKDNVYERFQIDKINKDISDLLGGSQISVKENTIFEDQPEHEITYNVRNKQVVIIEGVVALSSEKLRELSDFKIFVSLPEEQRLLRIKEYYQWRGRSKVEINKLINKRKTEEYQLIEKDIKFADVIAES